MDAPSRQGSIFNEPRVPSMLSPKRGTVLMTAAGDLGVSITHPHTCWSLSVLPTTQRTGGSVSYWIINSQQGLLFVKGQSGANETKRALQEDQCVHFFTGSVGSGSSVLKRAEKHFRSSFIFIFLWKIEIVSCRKKEKHEKFILWKRAHLLLCCETDRGSFTVIVFFTKTKIWH